jgi:regulator of replication initiation timing
VQFGDDTYGEERAVEKLFRCIPKKYKQIARSIEANFQLRMELDAAQSRLAEAECREHALTSDYEGLKKDFGDLRSSLAIVVKEKADLEKTEREKAQWFLNSLRNKLAEL